MANSEAGWTDEFPQVEETFYWMRHKQNHADINVGLLRDRTLLLAEGSTHSKAHRRWDFEYLPASPSDTEQLIELRKAAQVVRERHQAKAQRCNFDDCGCDDCDVLRAVLNPRHPEKEMQ